MNIKDLTESLDYLFKAELTPFIWGHAGLGKSSVVKQYAKTKGYKFFPFYLGTQSDIGDILGLAEFVSNPDGSKSTAFAHPKWLNDMITYCNDNPDSGAVIFLDEFNRARRDILSGMFSLALDKTFHTLKLPNNCHIVAAGNPPTDEYFVTDVDETALMARFVHIKLEPTFGEWLDYAKSKEFDANILGFLRDQPELLEQTRTPFELPIKVDRRAWERLHNFKRLNPPDHLLEGVMMGIIGVERTVAYQQYLKKQDKPLEGLAILDPKNQDLIVKWSNPENVVASLLNLTCQNLKTLITERKESFSKKDRASLMRIFDTVPKDVSFPMIEELVKLHNPYFKEFFTDPLYEKALVKLVMVAKGKE